MNPLYFGLAAISGSAIAWILNKIFAAKIEEKNYRIALKIISFIVCIMLGIFFPVLDSVRTGLTFFIERRIESLETELIEVFPNSNILEMPIDTSGFILAIDELQRTVNYMDTSGNNFLESLVFDAFSNKLNNYIFTIMTGDNNGVVTIKSILYHLKDMTMETIEPYFVFGQIGILILLIVYIGIYAGVVVFLKKGGALYNKSIVFGDITPDTTEHNLKAKSDE